MHHANHVSLEEMRRFVGRELPALQAQELLSHLLTGCSDCLALARREGALEAGEGPHEEDAADGFEYSAVLRRLEAMLRVAERDVEVQLQRGAAQWARLAPLSPERRLTLLRNDRSLHHWGLLRHALDACARAGRMNPVEAVDVACFAVAVAETLDVQAYPPANLNDFRSRALTALANAKRAAADFKGSEQAFAAARQAMEQGTGDPYERANVLSHEALLLRDLGEFEAAVEILDEAFKLYRRVNDSHLCGRVLIQQASSIGYVDPLKGVELARRGLAMLDPAAGDDFLELSARNALAHCLNDAGFAEEARDLHEACRPLYAKFPGVVAQSRMGWLDGLIARNLGDFHTAEKKLRELREVFSRHNFDLELVLVSLDLAELLLWSRRSAEAALLLRETFPVLVAWGLEKDLLVLWLTLADHLQAGTDEATLLMRDAAAVLRRGWNRRRAP
jgi:tetratricopeptide (TPR) repeat protein